MAKSISRQLGLLLLVSTAACSGGAEPLHNAKYFSEHPDARAEMLKRCSKDQNTENPINCIAAQDAQMIAVGGK